MPSRDFVRFLPNQRVDLPDFLAIQRNNRTESRIGLRHLLYGAGTTGEQHVFGGFKVQQDSGGPSPIIEITAGTASGIEVLPDGTEDKGLLYGLTDPATKTVDLSGNPIGSYEVYISFVQDPGALGARVFWNDNTQEEDVDVIETRLITGWNVRVTTGGSPGPQWQLIATVAWNGATVTNANITEERVFFFEGSDASGYAPVEWGGGFDRNPDRATYGVADLRTFVRAVQRQLQDIMGDGQMWWEAPINPINDHVNDNENPHGPDLLQTRLEIGERWEINDGFGGAVIGYQNIDEWVTFSTDNFIGNGAQNLFIDVLGGSQTLVGQTFYDWFGNGPFSVFTEIGNVIINSDADILIGAVSPLVRLGNDGGGSLRVTNSGVGMESRLEVFLGTLGGDTLMMLDDATWEVGQDNVGPAEGLLRLSSYLQFQRGNLQYAPQSSWSAVTPALGTGNTGFFELQREFGINSDAPRIRARMNGRAAASFINTDDIEANRTATGSYYCRPVGGSVQIDMHVPLTAFGIPNGAVIESIEAFGEGLNDNCQITVRLRRINDASQTAIVVGTDQTLLTTGVLSAQVDGLAHVLNYDSFSYSLEVVLLNDGATSECRLYGIFVEWGMPAVIPKISGDVTY